MINALINKHLPKAFDNQLTDAVQVFNGLRKGTGGEYDPVTDSYIGASDTKYIGRGVFGSYKASEVIDTEIKLTDTKLTALVIELTEYPKVDDVLTLVEQELRVLDVGLDPTRSVYTMQLRGLNVG